MLIKQFSLRRLLGAVTLCGFACLAFAAALRDQLWTAGLVIALVGLAVTMVLQGAMFVLVWCLGRAIERFKGPTNV